jgi:hypothetical protein
LRFRERAIAELVSGVDQFDADRAAIDVALALPGADSRMPGAALFGNQAVGGPLLVDHVMRADLGLGIAQPGQRRLGTLHARVMQHEHIDGAALGTRIVIGRGAVDRIGQTHRRQV